jgi:hypothetical protein
MNQTEQDAGAAAKPNRARKFKWLAAVFFVVLAAVAIMNLPRGFSDDLSLIGKGKPAIVFIRDKNAVQTFGLLEVMNGIRDQYAGQVEFLLTDFDTKQGRAFMAANEAPRVSMVLLDADGKKVKVIFPPLTAESLQQEIDGLLRATPQRTSDGTTGETTSHLTRLSKHDCQVIGYSQSTRLLKDNSQVAGYGRAPG